MMNPESYFLPYQLKWLQDKSRFKLSRKSRRIGLTYIQSYEDVRDCARADDSMDVWFSSADESAAKEWIRYCAQWVKMFDIAAEDLGEIVLDKKRGVKALAIELATGKRLMGLSSNPAAFRSKGGKLVLDEFAFHAAPDALWKAAMPIVAWGYPVRVISTYNGKGNRYYRMADAALKGNNWSVHTTTIVDAIDQGLLDKIKGRKTTEAERLAFIQEMRDLAGDEETFQQEFMCVPVDEATAWLTWELIISGEHADAGNPKLYQGGPCYVGMDIARRGHLAVIWVDEKIGDIAWTREVVTMKNATFAEQDAELDRVMEQYNVQRVCMDQTGMGEKPVEDAKKRHGQYKVEGVLFSGTIKQHLAMIGKQLYEDRKVRVPPTVAIRNSHHAVRKTTTAAGNVRFDADSTEVGHADEFWAHMLAKHAAENTAQPSAGASVEATADSMMTQQGARKRREMFGRMY